MYILRGCQLEFYESKNVYYKMVRLVLRASKFFKVEVEKGGFVHEYILHVKIQTL